VGVRGWGTPKTCTHWVPVLLPFVLLEHILSTLLDLASSRGVCIISIGSQQQQTKKKNRIIIIIIITSSYQQQMLQWRQVQL
jgi:hypothetical protein